MDWQTILASTLSSTTLAAGIVFLLKRTFDKAIDTKFREIESRQRLNLEELKRRDAKLFDDQYDLLKSILGLVYRVRNFSRDINHELSKGKYDNDFLKDLLNTLKEYQNSLEVLLFDNRAILPDSVFKEMHDLKHKLTHLDLNIHNLSRIDSNNKREALKIIDMCYEDHKSIDTHYSIMTGIIQSSIRIKKSSN